MHVIAECGINHGGNLMKALKMIEVAKESGADAVKFQFYDPMTLRKTRGLDLREFAVLNKNRMAIHWLPRFKEYCDKLNIGFLCTGFCKETFKAIDPFVKSHKISSTEAMDIDLIKYVATSKKPIMISTGKSDDDHLDRIFDEIDAEIILLYCVSNYPTDPVDVNLSEIERLKKKYKCDVGFSDHTTGIRKAIEACDHGACLVEKHFTLNVDCIDKEVSIIPLDFRKMADAIGEKCFLNLE